MTRGNGQEGKKKEMTAAVGNYYTDNRIGLNFLEFVGSTGSLETMPEQVLGRAREIGFSFM